MIVKIFVVKEISKNKTVVLNLVQKWKVRLKSIDQHKISFKEVDFHFCGV